MKCPYKEQQGFYHFECERNDPYQCDNCNTPFCSDHGTPGGDREGREGEVAQAYPSLCWKCGGFNAQTQSEVVPGFVVK